MSDNTFNIFRVPERFNHQPCYGSHTGVSVKSPAPDQIDEVDTPCKERSFLSHCQDFFIQVPIIGKTHIDMKRGRNFQGGEILLQEFKILPIPWNKQVSKNLSDVESGFKKPSGQTQNPRGSRIIKSNGRIPYDFQSMGKSLSGTLPGLRKVRNI